MVLTKSYQKLSEKKMGSWGYGTLYLRTYAKYDNSNNIICQARIYNKGSNCYSGNCYAKLQGDTVKNNVSITFDSNSEYTLGTKTISGRSSATITASFKCYALGSSWYEVSGTVTLPLDKATASDFDIGSTCIVYITRNNTAYTRTVTASIGSYSKTLINKGTETTISVYDFDVNQLYSQIPNANTGTITLTCQTYNGNTLVGSQTSTVKCRVTNSNPEISSVVFADTLNVVPGSIVRYKSNVVATITALSKNQASLVKYTITPENGLPVESNSNVVNLGEVKSNKFSIYATDSRGNKSTVSEFIISNFIEYVTPVITSANIERIGEDLDKVKVMLSGEWFKGALGNTQNAIALKYKYKIGDGEYSELKNITPLPMEASFEIESELEDTFNTISIYDIVFFIQDNISENDLATKIQKSIPLIDHWEDDDGDNYNINANFQVNGNRVMSEKIIYDGDSNTNITLDESISTAKKIKIEYRTNDDVYSSTTVYSPKNKRICLMAMFPWASSKAYLKSAVVTVSDMSITFNYYSEVTLGSTVSVTNSSNIYITKVIMYK